MKDNSCRIVIVTKFEYSAPEVTRLFGCLSEAERKLISIRYCKSYQTVLDKLLEIDGEIIIPKVVILESLVRLLFLLILSIK